MRSPASKHWIPWWGQASWLHQTPLERKPILEIMLPAWRTERGCKILREGPLIWITKEEIPWRGHLYQTSQQWLRDLQIQPKNKEWGLRKEVSHVTEPANCYIGRKNDRKKRNLFDVASRLLKIHFYFASLPPPLYQRKLRQSWRPSTFDC